MASFDEAFRIIAANVDAALDDLDLPTVAVTSPGAGEGKTVTCVKLAASFAAQGYRVVLVDLDLRQPGAHDWLGAHNRFGAVDVLREHRTLSECLQRVELPGGADATPAPGLVFLAAGTPPPSPGKLLADPRADRMLDALALDADVVLVDSPPVLPVADTLTIGQLAGAAVLVVDPRRTRADPLQRSRDLLRRHHVRVLGMILNQVHPTDASVSASAGYGYPAERTPGGT